jgi:acyl-CoA hydrolase
MYKSVTAEQAVKIINSNNRVYIQAAAAVPQELINAMTERHEELRDVEICHLHLEGETPYADPKYKDSFHVNSLFIGHNVRHTLKAGNGSYTPVFLSEVPLLFKRNILPVDVALIQVSMPDRHGYCSLGVSVEASLAAIDNANHVIALISDA